MDFANKIKTGVYAIVCKNGRVYVGSYSRNNRNVFRRWMEHRRDLRLNHHSNKHLQRTWNKYGEVAFQFILLHGCQPDECLLHEQMCIDWYNSKGIKLFNSNPAGTSNLGTKWTEESKKKQSERVKGTTLSEEHKKSIADGLRASLSTPEAKDKLSKNRRGVPKSEGHKKSISESHFARNKRLLDEATNMPPAESITTSKPAVEGDSTTTPSFVGDEEGLTFSVVTTW